MIFTMYLAPSGVTSLSNLRTRTPFAAGPRAPAISRKTSWMADGLGCASRLFVLGRAAPATAPRSPCSRYAAVNSCALRPESSSTIRQSRVPPTCSVVSSHAGKGRPEKKTAATAASSTGTDFRYSANSAVFCSFLVVAAILSAVSANVSIGQFDCRFQILDCRFDFNSAHYRPTEPRRGQAKHQ